MECNKDEAGRAKEIAERKFNERDYAGAKRFLLKAHNLYSGLEGLSQMLTSIDVFISRENIINDEVDWYGVLDVNPVADHETVRKQYRKLALMLHPDKNKSLGADDAFKLVSEAWSLLSDKAKRVAYNQRRNMGGVQQKVQFQNQGASVAPGSHGYRNATNTSSSYPRTQHKNTRAGPPPTPSHQRSATFWTICNRCKTHYEYLRVYLNHTLLCPNCEEAFYALERSPPANVFKPSNCSSHQQDQNKSQKVGGINFKSSSNLQRVPFSKTTGVGATVPNCAAARVVQQSSERVKRELEAQHKKIDSSSKLDEKRRRMNDIHVNGHVADMKTHMRDGKAGASCGNAPGSGMYGLFSPDSKLNNQKEISLLELRKLLVDNARVNLKRKLKEWNLVTENKSMEKETFNANERGNKKRNVMVNVDGAGMQKNGESVRSSKGDHDSNKPNGVSNNVADKDGVEPMSINVPDPGFHNFDSYRTEGSFADDQIWAVYDDDEGMPRFYARIHKVISLKPLKLQISWLNSKSNSELGTIDWIGSGFYKTCGDFRIGKYEITKSLNSFSHKVNWAKGARGSICIYPSKGDVWALYKNWSPDWNENTPDEVIRKYDMVEVLDDYNEESGVSVTPLVKVGRFRTVFHRHMDPKEVRSIHKEEMFRFSHQVPTYLLTGQEHQNAPKGCWELDPAATPIELLQVVTNSNEPFVAGNGERN